jgi:hypothetical protein
VAAAANGLPSALLRRRRLSKRLSEPACDERMKRGEGHPPIIAIGDF